MKQTLFMRQLAAYFETHLPHTRHRSQHTIAAYADSFALLFQFLQERRGLPHYRVNYRDFTPATLDDFVLWLGHTRHYSPASQKQRLSAVTSFLKYASRREMAALSAFTSAADTETPQVARSEFPYFTVEEIRVLLRLPDLGKKTGRRNLVLLSLLYESAARAQELCNLCVGDVKFGSPTKVKLRGKGNKTREIPVSDDVASLLRYHLKQNRLEGCREKPLFSSQTKEKMTPACIRSLTEKYVAQAKAAHPYQFFESKYSPHSFRHSKAVHMVEMQYVFIANIKHILKKQRRETAGFNLQTVVSTHSAHIVSQCDFQDIKYFYRVADEVNSVKSKSLKHLCSLMVTTAVTATDDNERKQQERERSEQEAAFRFVKQYVTLHRAEMFFADKAILIEGDTERILISAMMKKYDDSKKTDADYTPLMSQNVSVIEVGAYAKVFSTFLGFVGIKTVIFTDLDCAKTNANNRSTACSFVEASLSTNASIQYFLGTNSIAKIVGKSADERTLEYDAASKLWCKSKKGHLRVCYQREENNYQPSSFEDAFLCKNMRFIIQNKGKFQGLKCTDELVETATDFYGLADMCIKSKTTFALDILMNGGSENELWSTPKYIEEGLEWLSM